MKKISISVLTVLSLFVGSFYLNTVEARESCRQDGGIS